jgi:hypothetical protein
MKLFGCGNTWKIELDSENNFPSQLWLSHNKGIKIVSVTGPGKTLKE